MIKVQLLQGQVYHLKSNRIKLIHRMNHTSHLTMILGPMFTFHRGKRSPLSFTVSYRIYSMQLDELFCLLLSTTVAPVMAIKGKTYITIKRNDQLLRLKCRVYGSPLPSVQWLKESMYLVSPDQLTDTDQSKNSSSNENDDSFTIYNESLSYSISKDIKSKCSIKSTLTLTINSVDDLGWYHCIAKNKHGKVHASYRVEGKLSLSHSTRSLDTYLALSQLNHLECSQRTESLTSLAS